jgi:hypothetical protein
MKHLKIFEGYSPKSRFPSIAVFLAIPADNDSMKTSYLKEKSGKSGDVNNSMVNADYVVRGIGSLLSEIEEAGLDARYSGAIKKAKAALIPAVMKTKEYQLPKEIE